MIRHFKPNQFKRSNQKRDERIKQDPLSNQPEPDIFCIMNFNPKPSDRIWVYQVNPKRVIEFTELEKIAHRLGELYGSDVFVSEYLFNNFHVYLTEAVAWRDICKHTLTVMRELDP